MLGNIFKIIAAIMAGFFVGLLSGAILGILLGMGVSLFFREIVFSHQTILMSILLSLILGGLLGTLAVQIINRIFETDDRPIIGGATGAAIGLIVAVFIYGYIDIPNPATFKQTLYKIPILYSTSLGSQIGAIIFSLTGAVAVIREMFNSYLELRKNLAQQADDKPKLSYYPKRNPIDRER